MHLGLGSLLSQRKRKTAARGDLSKGSAKKTSKTKKANTQTPSKGGAGEVLVASDPELYRAMLSDADGGDAAIDKWVSRYEDEEQQYVPADAPSHSPSLQPFLASSSSSLACAQTRTRT